ncbi:MAG: class I SAM-dependent methyltransferase [Opitutae bacterium]|nr:class I SAM-dependent methyltransferase [Opitutae bacterium]
MMPDQNGQEETSELLLASMIFFEPILEPILKELKPRSLCEIGIDQGRFTRKLLEFCKDQSCNYTGIDPKILDQQLLDLAHDGVRFIQEKSVDVLPDLPPHELYIIDGDHNYYTVKQEIRLIFQHPEHLPVFLFHDTAWPFARRDLYYDPETIPVDQRNPYSADGGPWPGKQNLSEDGFCATESMCIATAEGGPDNGVLTAIEDAKSEKIIPEIYRTTSIPIVFGCTLLYPSNMVSAAALKKIKQLGNSTETLHPLLESMESNRLRLYLELVASWKKFNKLDETYGALITKYKELMGKYRDLHDHSDQLLDDYRDLARHKRDLETKIGNSS